MAGSLSMAHGKRNLEKRKKLCESSFSNKYIPSWRNHPNLSWRNYQSTQPSNHAPCPSQYTVNQQSVASGSPQYPTAEPYGHRRNLEDIGKFPAQPQPNPQGQIHQVSEAVETSNTKPVKAVTTLRSGKILVNSTPNSATISKDSIPEHVETKVNNFQTHAPFPTRLTPVHKDKYHAEIFEVSKQVRINIPLLDAIQQILTYAKFLKDLCTVKRKLNVKKKAFLTKQVSAIRQNNTPPKYKNPGSPTIACMIGNSKIGHALLDLGSSVNLLPYYAYEKLGLGELKSTSTTLQLVDRLIKIPRGVVEDVLVQIDKVYYPVDFVVLDLKLSTNSLFQAPIILGRPFLATSNTLINCISGVLKLSFGNMTLELNTFNLCRQPQEVEEVQEVNMLDNISSENCHLSYQLCDSLIDLENISMSNEGSNELFSASIARNPAEVQWKLKFE
ncbi:uncharacterized protein LOC122310219 [Carya illinoinensis]|uniref:uncharacterized protein LOC122310219 n=1 Tax=Carya illinoinensis TaxID=32201 RepID=UPI001C71E1CE|nr:uncharacterized protein LOC122310219 [Carya illinoinensis]